MTYQVQQVHWQDAAEQLKMLRKAVYVLEWRLPESTEFDERDSKAIHILMFADDKAVATGRLTHNGEIGRIAVLPSHRNLAVYKLLFAELLNLADQQNIEKIQLQSDLTSVDYHREQGYEPIGPVFMEAGIAMQKMVCHRQKFAYPDVSHIH